MRMAKFDVRSKCLKTRSSYDTKQNHPQLALVTMLGRSSKNDLLNLRGSRGVRWGSMKVSRLVNASDIMKVRVPWRTEASIQTTGLDSAKSSMRADTDSKNLINLHPSETFFSIHHLRMMQRFLCLRRCLHAKYILVCTHHLLNPLDNLMVLQICPKSTLPCPLQGESRAQCLPIRRVRPPSLLPLPQSMYHLARRHLCLPSQKLQAQKWALYPGGLGLSGIPQVLGTIHPKCQVIMAFSLRLSHFHRAAPLSSHHRESWKIPLLDLTTVTTQSQVALSTNLRHRVGLLMIIRF